VKEKRVCPWVHGTLKPEDSRLQRVASAHSKPEYLHRVAARAFDAMRRDVRRDLGIDLRVAAGWRSHRWKDRDEYDAFLMEKYGNTGPEAQKWVAFYGPHETGLAFDLGAGGLWPESDTVDQQATTPLYKWLVKNAHKYGVHPYLLEPWHWEVPLPQWQIDAGVGYPPRMVAGWIGVVAGVGVAGIGVATVVRRGRA
jgi:LAS superfamily LD-carboxypeptidase LdcB